MFVNLDRHGRVVQSGEGSYNVPMGTDEVDNTLSHPVSQAEALAHRQRREYALGAAKAQANSDQDRAAIAHQHFVDSLASEYEEFISEEAAEANGGENPLLYAAAMQTLAGGCADQHTPLGGYLLSQDGQLAYDRAMSGNVIHGMGQVQALIQAAQTDYSQAQAAVAPLIAAAQGGAQVAAVANPVGSAAPNALSTLMQQKVGGIPVPYLAAGLAAFLFLRK